MNAAHKKIRPSAWCVGAGPKAFLARQVPTSGRRKTAAKTDSCGWAARYEIWPHLFLYDGRFLRAEGHSRRCRSFESVAAHAIGDVHRIHAGRPLGVSYGGERRPANSGAVRPQNSMNDERPTMNGLSPAVRPLNCVNDTILCQNETNDRQYSISKYT